MLSSCCKDLPLLVQTLRLLLFLLYSQQYACALSNQVSRLDWIKQIFATTTTTTTSNLYPITRLNDHVYFLPTDKSIKAAAATAKPVTIDLIFLPKAGCLGLPVVLNGVCRYLAVVDTGSPFLTAPQRAVQFSQGLSKVLPPSSEQYGETIGNLQWRSAKVVIGDNNNKNKNIDDDNNNNQIVDKQITFAVVSDDLVANTGGIFFGTMLEDDHRPTVMEQLGYTIFTLDYTKKQLTLSCHRLPIDNNPLLSLTSLQHVNKDELVPSLPLFDLSPFGPNLHHYAVRCCSVVLHTSKVSLVLRNMSRPVVVVIDSGLTGCVLSDSWLYDLQQRGITDLSTLKGATITLCNDDNYYNNNNGVNNASEVRSDMISLTSQPEYWYLSCFRLPWFTSESNHPHILAAGGTFLNGHSITIDTSSKQLWIE